MHGVRTAPMAWNSSRRQGAAGLALVWVLLGVAGVIWRIFSRCRPSAKLVAADWKPVATVSRNCSRKDSTGLLLVLGTGDPPHEHHREGHWRSNKSYSI